MADTKPHEGRLSSLWSSIAPVLYGAIKNQKLRVLLRNIVLRAEGGPVYSLTAREIYRRFHGVTVGLYTLGPLEAPPGTHPSGTTIGRYSSVYYTVRTIERDEPASTRFPAGIISDASLGTGTGSGDSGRARLTIGNDVWIGHNAILLPTVAQIGDGAVIGAGSVVKSDVPPYAVVTGNPARVVRYRFSESKIKELLEEKWWLKSIDELSSQMAEFQKPLEGAVLR